MFKRPRPPPQHLADRMRQVTTPRALTEPGPAPDSSRTHREPRTSVFRQATLVFDDGQRFPVVVKDVSEDGAKVEFFIRTDLPQRFTLIEPTLKLHVRASVVWQRDGAAGLHFLKP